ncbi:hypothetical protein [Streptantibioticus silvisoli]|uniref:Uncharacterized protein n=1 Tax=Streptantibioticus silvisoli TaxID=2705255 RepID=A0ABT6VSL9_9ACTN|nr:hypothetical protein [Streptantibioticus silvisoli]MDI5961468.1 hypothetical protein [Streptantibioticus silvisoli]
MTDDISHFRAPDPLSVPVSCWSGGPEALPRPAPPAEDVFGSAETLMTRFTAQLTVQLAHLRPFPQPTGADAGPPLRRRAPRAGTADATPPPYG